VLFPILVVKQSALFSLLPEDYIIEAFLVEAIIARFSFD